MSPTDSRNSPTPSAPVPNSAPNYGNNRVTEVRGNMISFPVLEIYVSTFNLNQFSFKLCGICQGSINHTNYYNNIKNTVLISGVKLPNVYF